MTTIYTKWGSDIVAVSAEWSQAACQVIGDKHGRQVADFRHSPEAALRASLADCASSEGMDNDDAETAIEAAMSHAVHADSYLAKYHERE